MPWSAAVVVACCVLISGCGAAGSQHTVTVRATGAGPAATSSSTAAAHTTTTVVTVAHRRRPRDRRPNPGSLPQTQQQPTATGHAFKADVAALWSAIRAGSVRPGRRAFFPEAAYVQVKAIGDPEADYRDRLLADYGLDIMAAHALLGPGAGAARLVDVIVPPGYAHWVPPGVCDNRVGYYEVPNSRLVYRLGGEIRSIGIASMISWRGVWYVIHMGAVLRGAAAGIVDDPSQGPGQSVPSSTC